MLLKIEVVPNVKVVHFDQTNSSRVVFTTFYDRRVVTRRQSLR